MQRKHTLRYRLLSAATAVALFASISAPAHAANKEMIELQTQVQQLLDMVQRLQSTMDSRFGAMQHMVETTADDANRMSATVNELQQKLSAQSEAGSGKLDTVSGQIQSLNDSLDELKSRIAKVDKSLQEMQTQLQNVQTAPAVPAPVPVPATPAAAPTQAPAPQAAGAPEAPGAAPAVQAPSLKDTYQGAERDYNAARYEIAAAEFQDVVHYYPLDELAGNAQFYLGEIAYRQKNYNDAVKAYNAVLEAFPGNAHAPAAQLRKGLALLQMNKKDSAVHELRLLIQRHPQTPEASQARAKLNGLGVKIAATH